MVKEIINQKIKMKNIEKTRMNWWVTSTKTFVQLYYMEHFFI